MSEYISKQMAIKAIEAIEYNEAEFYGDESDRECFNRGSSKAEDAIEQLPAADVAPIVRCKNCKFLMHAETEGGWCDVFEFHTSEEDYCSTGEPKEADHE